MNYKVPSIPKLVLKTLLCILLVWMTIETVWITAENYIEDQTYRKDLTNMVRQCDDYYYKKNYGRLRDFLILYELYEDEFDIYWEAVNGCLDFENYRMYKSVNDLEKMNEFKQKVIDNATHVRFNKNEKQLNGYKSLLESEE